MTLRQNFECESCHKVTALRILLGYREVEQIEFACEECSNRISCELHLDQNRGEIIGFKKLKGAKEAYGANDFVFNYSGNFAQPAGTQRKDGVFSFIEAFSRGGEGEEFLLRIKRQQLLIEIADGHTDKIKQIIRTYESANWKHFERLTKQYHLEANETMEDSVSRDSALLRAMEHYLGPLILSQRDLQTIAFQVAWLDALAGKAGDAFGAFLDEVAQAGYLERAWREGLDLYLRVFANIQHVRQVLSEWDPEKPDRVDAPSLVVTSPPEFDTLKSLYVDGYEFLARALTLTSGLENIQARGNHDAYLRHPTIKNYRPRSLEEFHKGSNAPKREYATSSFAQGVANAMDPQLRNGLGHFSARLDGSTSLVSYPADLSGSETLQLPYASFLLRLVRLSMRIQEVVYFIKFLRVYVSRKRENASTIHYGVNSLGLVIAAGGSC